MRAPPPPPPPQSKNIERGWEHLRSLEDVGSLGPTGITEGTRARVVCPQWIVKPCWLIDFKRGVCFSQLPWGKKVYLAVIHVK